MILLSGIGDWKGQEYSPLLNDRLKVLLQIVSQWYTPLDYRTSYGRITHCKIGIGMLMLDVYEYSGKSAMENWKCTTC